MAKGIYVSMPALLTSLTTATASRFSPLSTEGLCPLNPGQGRETCDGVEIWAASGLSRAKVSPEHLLY
jgi:hypothetical protein